LDTALNAAPMRHLFREGYDATLCKRHPGYSVRMGGTLGKEEADSDS